MPRERQRLSATASPQHCRPRCRIGVRLRATRCRHCGRIRKCGLDLKRLPALGGIEMLKQLRQQLQPQAVHGTARLFTPTRQAPVTICSLPATAMPSCSSCKPPLPVIHRRPYAEPHDAMTTFADRRPNSHPAATRSPSSQSPHTPSRPGPSRKASWPSRPDLAQRDRWALVAIGAGNSSPMDRLPYTSGRSRGGEHLP